MSKPQDDYDPMAGVIASNQEAIIRVYREGMRRINQALGQGKFTLIPKIIEAANTFHPMHGESWSGWPENE